MSRAEDRPYVTVGQDKRHFQKAIRAFILSHTHGCIVLGFDERDREDVPCEQKDDDVD